MKSIKPSKKPELRLDDILDLNIKEHKKPKKKNKKNKKKKKNKNEYIYHGHCNKNIFQRITDCLNVDVKSKVKVNITDDTINNAINTGVSLIKYLFDKKSNNT